MIVRSAHNIAAGIQAPEMVNGIKQKPIEGVSMALHLRPGKRQRAVKTRHTDLEMAWQSRDLSRWLDCRHYATYTAVAAWVPARCPTSWSGYHWELYNITEDYSEYNDLAAKNPDKLKELQALFLTEAAKYQVFPMDNFAPPARGYAAAKRDRGANCLHLRWARTSAFPSRMLPIFWTRTTASPQT